MQSARGSRREWCQRAREVQPPGEQDPERQVQPAGVQCCQEAGEVQAGEVQPPGEQGPVRQGQPAGVQGRQETD